MNDILLEEGARLWLIWYDPEATAFWLAQPVGGLVDAVDDNIRDFGEVSP